MCSRLKEAAPRKQSETWKPSPHHCTDLRWQAPGRFGEGGCPASLEAPGDTSAASRNSQPCSWKNRLRKGGAKKNDSLLALTACVGRGQGPALGLRQAPWRVGKELAWKLESTIIPDASKGKTVAKKRLLPLKHQEGLEGEPSPRDQSRDSSPSLLLSGTLTLNNLLTQSGLGNSTHRLRQTHVHSCIHSCSFIHSFAFVRSFIRPTGISPRQLPWTEMCSGKS